MQKEKFNKFTRKRETHKIVLVSSVLNENPLCVVLVMQPKLDNTRLLRTNSTVLLINRASRLEWTNHGSIPIMLILIL